MCHDYPPTDRPIAFETTVAEQRAKNIHVHDGVSEAQFVEMRTKRDETLEMPVLILPAVLFSWMAKKEPQWIPDEARRKVIARWMLGGSIVIEQVFALHGVGFLAWESIQKNDFPVVQSVVLVLAVIYVALTMLSDLLNAVLDPRLRGA